MSYFQYNLAALIAMQGITQAAFAKSIGKTPGAVSQWLNDESRMPSEETLEKICEVYGIEKDDLTSERGMAYTACMTGVFVKSNRSPTGYKWSRVARENSDRINEVLSGILQEDISVPEEVMERHPRGFYIKAEDNSMSKVYPAGCHLFVDPELEPSNGSIAVIREEDKFVCRRMFKATSTIVLSPESWEDGWEDIVLTRKKMPNEFFGTVVWFQASGELE